LRIVDKTELKYQVEVIEGGFNNNGDFFEINSGDEKYSRYFDRDDKFWWLKSDFKAFMIRHHCEDL